MAAPTLGGGTGFRSTETWDLVRGVLDWRLWAFLGLQDIRQRYRRSLLGPFWLTLGLGATVLGIGLLYSEIMKADARTFIPYIALSLLIWTFIQTCLNESTALFLGAQNVITAVKIPYTSFVLRLLTRNLIVAAHGIIVVVLAFVWYRYPVTPIAVVSIAGLALLLANLYWITLLVSLVSARFRDMAQMVIYAVSIVFFVTPIIWMPTTIRAGSPFLKYNPFAQLIEAVRAPIFFHTIPTYSFLFLSGMFVVGMGATLLLFFKARRHLVYWV